VKKKSEKRETMAVKHPNSSVISFLGADETFFFFVGCFVCFPNGIAHAKVKTKKHTFFFNHCEMGRKKGRSARKKGGKCVFYARYLPTTTA
jgi:hypothetical protein